MVENFIIEGCPNSAYYIPEFITVEEEQSLLRHIYNVPQTKWIQLSRRRLQNWGGVPYPKGMVQEPIPQWLQTCMKKVADLNVFKGQSPNHVLVNEYKCNEGIMPHLDGPLYFPVIATVNLGSHTVLNFYKSSERDQKAFSFFLEPRSLLIQESDIYENYLHGIEEKGEDMVDGSICNLSADSVWKNQLVKRDTRVSLTIRHVLKISKIKMTLSK